MFILRLLFATLLVAYYGVSGIPTISIKGSKFFTSDGEQFYIKGIVYQSATSTANYLSNGPQCQIDAKLIAATGANVIRVYSVDPTLNHDVCMQAFESQGIYVICDMSTPTYYINSANPQWTLDLRDQFAKVLDGFHQYDNLLAFFAGNEVINNVSTTNAAPAVKAVIADMKAYRDLMQYRKIPIGYASTDSSLLSLQQSYFDCGNSSIAADFFGLNDYSWCGDSSFTESGYDQLYASADGYDIPIFLAETGCNEPRPRTFSDQVALLGRQMNDRFSGSIVYEWHQEANNYGLANYSNSALTGTPTLVGEYTSLKNQWATLSPVGVNATTYNPSLTKRSCPSSVSGSWLVNAAAGTSLPTLGLSGFTAPAGAKVSTTTGGSDSKNSGYYNGYGNKESSKLGGGAIAGIVIGCLAGLAILIGAIFLLLRRRKAKANAAANDGTTGHSDMIAVGPNDASYKTPGLLPELGGERPRQELGPAQSHELRGESQIGELPYQTDAGYHQDIPFQQHQHQQQQQHQQQYQDVQYNPVSGGVHTNHEAEQYTAAVPTTEPSEHVQAQRRREMEWLEAEEARMRQRREALMNQNQGQSSGI